MGNDKKQGRPAIHDEPMEPAATRLPAAVIAWLFKRHPEARNKSEAVRNEVMDGYAEEDRKNWANDNDWPNE